MERKQFNQETQVHWSHSPNGIKPAVMDGMEFPDVLISVANFDFVTIFSNFTDTSSISFSSKFFWCYWRLLETLMWKHVLFLCFSCCSGPLPHPTFQSPHRWPSPQATVPQAASRTGDVQPSTCILRYFYSVFVSPTTLFISPTAPITLHPLQLNAHCQLCKSCDYVI